MSIKKLAVATFSLLMGTSGLALLPVSAGATVVAGSTQVVSSITDMAGYENAYLATPSCSSPGNCTVAGMVKRNGANAIVVARQITGNWGTPQILTLDASITTLNYVQGISCPSQGNCTLMAGGGDGFIDPNYGSEANTPVVADQVDGTWGTATFQPGVRALTTRANSWPVGVDCSSPGNCVTGGMVVIDRRQNQSAVAYVAKEVNGTWSNAELAPGVEAIMPYENQRLEGVSCSPDGGYVLTGYISCDYSPYPDPYCTKYGYRPFVISYSNGSFSDAVELAMGGPVGTYGTYGGDATAASCTGTYCALVGYVSADGTYGNEPAVSDVDGSSVGTFTSLGLPDGYSGSAYFSSVSCTSSTSCLAMGPGWASDGSTVVVSSAKTIDGWSKPIVVPGFASLTTNAFVNGISCATVDDCVATGSYQLGSWDDSTARNLGFVIQYHAGTWGTPVTLDSPRVLQFNESLSGGIDCSSAEHCLFAGAMWDASYNGTPLLNEISPAGGSGGGGGGGGGGSSLTLAMATNPGTFGDVSTMTVTADPSSLSGSVSLRTAGGAKIGTCTLQAGTCSVTTSKLQVGTYDVYATLPAQRGVHPRYSATTSVTINRAATTVDTTGSDLTREHWPTTNLRRGRVLIHLSSSAASCAKLRALTVTVTNDATSTQVFTKDLDTKVNNMTATRSIRLSPGSYTVSVSVPETRSCASTGTSYSLTIT